jgi:hypothetical protein
MISFSKVKKISKNSFTASTLPRRRYGSGQYSEQYISELFKHLLSD